MYSGPNPFRFGDLALDEAFTDRAASIAELVADMRNGQNVVLYAPRRYGKTSLVWRAANEAVAENISVAYCDLMKTPTKERFAAALAKTIFDDLESPTGSVLERAHALFRGLRIVPQMSVDPEHGSLSFTFTAQQRRDIDETIERLLELPQRIAGERRRRVVLILDEFQEVVKLDPGYPNLMRSVFQTQPEVSHIYLGSRRHILDRIFEDRNQAFWRSAKRIEIGMIPVAEFRSFIKERFDATDKGITDEALDRLLEATHGHPYATQELAYYTWQEVATGAHAFVDHVEAALESVLRSENRHFSRIWEDATEHQRLLLIALADGQQSIYTVEFRESYGFPSNSYVQRAVKTLVAQELVGQSENRAYLIIEPFLAEWIKREQAPFATARGREV
jgi:AAA+ ATPase superfamily predicted ATPase